MDKEDEKQSKIRERAHQIWEQEGRPNGQEQAHWERATKEIEEEDQTIQPPAVVPTPKRPA
jgi:hypothetical protein